MTGFSLQPALADDLPAIVRLNAAAIAETGPMNGDRYRQFLNFGAEVTVARNAAGDDAVAFLLGFAAGKDYDGNNYRWFSRRLKNFFYIDRIIVAPDFAGGGIGRALYDRAAENAENAGLLWLAAEINTDPPNPRSLRFHKNNGFTPVAERPANGKMVSMQIRAIETA